MLYARDYRKKAWSKLSSNWGIAIGTYVVYALILAALAPTAIGTLLLTGPLTVGFSLIFLTISRNNKPEFGTLFSGFNNFGNTCLAGVLYTIFISLWSLLLVIPGIIKSYSYAMTFFILNDHPEMSGNDAITESRKMMNGNKWRLFCLDLSYIGWLILCALTAGILSLWVAPCMQMAHAEFYESLKSQNAQDAQTL